MSSEKGALDNTVNSIPVKIIQLAAERTSTARYASLLHVSQIINRSISNEDYGEYDRKHKLRHRGHFLTDKTDLNVVPDQNLIITHNDHEVIYQDQTFPSAYGVETIQYLDKKLTPTLSSRLPLPELINYSAFVTIIIAANHIFPDVNGRSAVGTADFILRKFAHKRLDMSKLSTPQTDERLGLAMAGGSVSMYPGKYNPLAIINAMKKDEWSKIISAPEGGFFLQPGLKERQQFCIDYVASMKHHIDSYSPKSKNGDQVILREKINEIADIYEECLRQAN